MILDDICAYKVDEVAARKKVISRDELEERASEMEPPRDFRAALREPGISLIAEVKFASPVKGRFLEGVDPVQLASAYESAGARAISVLTDEHFFQGHLDYLTNVRKSVSVPCLRKDFIVDEYQIHEARVAGADAILLIMSCLSDEQVSEYLAVAKQYQMAVLVETHTADELERALAADAHIIGINNRNLNTFEVDIATTLELKNAVPGGKVLVSESGIYTREDVVRLEDGGVDSVLVGEAIVTSGNVTGKVRELLDNDTR